MLFAALIALGTGVPVLSSSVVTGAAGSEGDSSNWYYDNWCAAHGLEYLDDAKCAKVFPSSFDRNQWSCPITYDVDSLPEGFALDKPLSSVDVDTETLGNVVTNGASICAIVTKRVQSSVDSDAVKLYHKYYCAGEYSRDAASETWSSSKIFAMANAAGHLRTNESDCMNSIGELGLDGNTEGKHGQTPLGDLSTVVCSYDTTAGYSSNSLSSYFHDIGFRDRLNELVMPGGWLWGDDSGKNNPEPNSLGGNYGEATPSDLGFTISKDMDGKGEVQCDVDKDPWPTVYDNSLSSLAAAEMTRRIVQYRDIPESMRFPGMTWEDAKEELYGAEESVLFPGLQWGGMTADTAIFIQSSLNMTTVEEKSQGKFRIFSKLGAGYSSSRSRGEIISSGHACLPVLDRNGNPVSNEGMELTISAKGSIPGDVTLKAAEQQVFTAMSESISTLMSMMENRK